MGANTAGYPAGMALTVLLLLVGAAVCFGLAAFRVTLRLELIALGLLCWVLTQLIPALAAL